MYVSPITSLNHKMGFTELWPEIIMTIIFILILIMIIVFVTSENQKEAFEKQVLAKQTALMLNNAKPGMELLISYDKKFILDFDEDLIIVNKIYEGRKFKIYSYKFLKTFDYSYESGLGKTKIIIKEKNEA